MWTKENYFSAHANFTAFLTVINDKISLCRYYALSCRQVMGIKKTVLNLRQDQILSLNIIAPGNAFISQGTVATDEFLALTNVCLLFQCTSFVSYLGL